MIADIVYVVIEIDCGALLLGLGLFASAQWEQGRVQRAIDEALGPHVPADVDLEQCVTTTRAIADGGAQ